MEQREIIKLAIVGVCARIREEEAAAANGSSKEIRELAAARLERLQAQFAELVEMSGQ